jgi:hypothetical protein
MTFAAGNASAVICRLVAVLYSTVLCRAVPALCMMGLAAQCCISVAVRIAVLKFADLFCIACRLGLGVPVSDNATVRVARDHKVIVQRYNI